MTRNQLTGLKLVNGAPYRAVEVYPDLSAGSITLASNGTPHLAPSLAVLLQSDDVGDLAIPRLPTGAILIQSKAVAIPEVMRGRSRGKPGFDWVTDRTEPLCTPALAMTDQKSQRSSSQRSFLTPKALVAAA